MAQEFIALNTGAPLARELKEWSNRTLRRAVDQAYQHQDRILRMRTAVPDTDPVAYDYTKVAEQYGFPSAADARRWAELLLSLLSDEATAGRVRDLASMV